MSGGGIPIDIIIFAIIAVVVALKLRSVLGKTDEDDLKPPSHLKRVETRNKEHEKVVQLYKDKAREILDEVRASEDIDLSDKPEIAEKIKKLKSADPRFNVREFMKGAELAFEMVLKAFAEGDKRTLKFLLSPELYTQFEKAIKDRADKETYEHSTLVSIPSSEIVDAEAKQRKISVTVAFVSEQITVTKNQKGEIVEGDPKQIEEVDDRWVFERKISANDPNWQLVKTS